jgi:hypothetical protein
MICGMALFYLAFTKYLTGPLVSGAKSCRRYVGECAAQRSGGKVTNFGLPVTAM